MTVERTVNIATAITDSHGDGAEEVRRELRARADQLLSRSLVAAAKEHSAQPREALRAMGRAYRDYALSHPGLYTLLFPSVLPQGASEGGGIGADAVELGASLLGQLGVPADRQLHLIRTYASLFHGCAVMELRREDRSLDVDAFFELALDQFLGAIDAEAAGPDRRHSS